jgi:hypothetical protein
MSVEELKKLTPIKRVFSKINIAPSRFDWYFKRTQFQIKWLICVQNIMLQ